MYFIYLFDNYLFVVYYMLVIDLGFRDLLVNKINFLCFRVYCGGKQIINKLINEYIIYQVVVSVMEKNGIG